MSIRDILPSMRFTTLVGSIALCALLIYGAYVLTHPSNTPSTIAVGSDTTSTTDWAKTLEEIQAQNPLNQAPEAPSADKVNALTRAATSDNLTDTVARTLFINLSAAKAEGLGNDIPTQDALIADAIAKINAEAPVPSYTTVDLTAGPNTPEATKAYGNTFMQVVSRHPKASYDAVLYTIGTSTANNNPQKLSVLNTIGADYTALAQELLRIKVPSTLAPLHVQIVNDIAQIAQTIPDIKSLYSDPLRSLAGLQRFEALNQETLRLFINIAQNFNQNGILFSKDEPGATWSSLVP
jgi:hypothetical protein